MNAPAPATPVPVQPFTLESLKAAWQEFAEQRKLYKAEFQLLNQEIELNDSTVVLHLMNPVQETLLNSLKAELMQFIREKLNNYTIQIQGELIVSDHKQVIYTNREKFEHLATKNPNLRILKDRLGLDPDY
jgi:DNA polymerase-3 subunit gamma/tau